MFSRFAEAGPKMGATFTLVNVGTGVKEGYIVDSLQSGRTLNGLYSVVAFRAVRYPSRELPLIFRFATHGYSPVGRIGNYSVVWGMACNDIEVVDLSEAS